MQINRILRMPHWILFEACFTRSRNVVVIIQWISNWSCLLWFYCRTNPISLWFRINFVLLLNLQSRYKEVSRASGMWNIEKRQLITEITTSTCENYRNDSFDINFYNISFLLLAFLLILRVYTPRQTTDIDTHGSF